MGALHIIAWVFLGLGIISCLIVYIDINMGRYQSMSIMNIAWPITCLYSSVLGLYMYFKYGRAAAPAGMQMHADHGAKKTTKKTAAKHSCGGMTSCSAKDKKAKPAKAKPFWVQIYISCTHCGAGCGSADIVSEILIYFVGITFWGAAIWASFFIDYAFALVFGLAFQYFNIMPMRPELSKLQGIWVSLTVDIWSLTSFQVGMYAWLLAVYYMFHGQLNAGSVIFWFMMQIGLTIGLLTTYPVNYILIKKGIKVPCAE